MDEISFASKEDCEKIDEKLRALMLDDKDLPEIWRS
jgi:hypothetical protein